MGMNRTCDLLSFIKCLNTHTFTFERQRARKTEKEETHSSWSRGLGLCGLASPVAPWRRRADPGTAALQGEGASCPHSRPPRCPSHSPERKHVQDLNRNTHRGIWFQINEKSVEPVNRNINILGTTLPWNNNSNEAWNVSQQFGLNSAVILRMSLCCCVVPGPPGGDFPLPKRLQITVSWALK